MRSQATKHENEYLPIWKSREKEEGFMEKRDERSWTGKFFTIKWVGNFFEKLAPTSGFKATLSQRK